MKDASIYNIEVRRGNWENYLSGSCVELVLSSVYDTFVLSEKNANIWHHLPLFADDGLVMEYGFRGVIAKPYKIMELSEVLHKVLNEGMGE